LDCVDYVVITTFQINFKPDTASKKEKPENQLNNEQTVQGFNESSDMSPFAALGIDIL
jgi:hypothetical protein